MDEVTYNVDYKDKTTSYIKNYPGGGPGEADIPPAVMLEWDSNGYSDKTTLKVWDGDWSRKYSLSAGVSKQELLNLVPNSTYHYTVTGSNNTAVAEGAFKTTAPVQSIRCISATESAIAEILAAGRPKMARPWYTANFTEAVMSGLTVKARRNGEPLESRQNSTSERPGLHQSLLSAQISISSVPASHTDTRE